MQKLTGQVPDRPSKIFLKGFHEEIDGQDPRADPSKAETEYPGERGPRGSDRHKKITQDDNSPSCVILICFDYSTIFSRYRIMIVAATARDAMPEGFNVPFS